MEKRNTPVCGKKLKLLFHINQTRFHSDFPSAVFLIHCPKNWKYLGKTLEYWQNLPVRKIFAFKIRICFFTIYKLTNHYPLLMRKGFCLTLLFVIVAFSFAQKQTVNDRDAPNSNTPV